jgi:uncharacterized protein YdeI (BOF family)
MIFVPVALRHTSSVDMVVIDPRDLRGAQLQDRRRINIRGKADKEP